MKKFLIFFFMIFMSASFTKEALGLGGLKGDGKVTLYNYHTGEVIEESYRSGKKYNKESLQNINSLMRSPDDKIFTISVSLIELLDDIQDHFEVETIEVVSGYRSLSYNKSLRLEGRGAAGKSLHTKGLAADIHIDEITEEALHDYALSLKAGGVGIYPLYNFVHVDTGDVRSWKEGASPGRVLIGMELNPNNLWKVVTNKNIYAKGESPSFSVTNVSYEKLNLVKNIWLEHFKKGKWEEQIPVEKKRKSFKLKPGGSVSFEINLDDLSFGKYRVVIFASRDFNIPPAYSNEFFVKKQ